MYSVSEVFVQKHTPVSPPPETVPKNSSKDKFLLLILIFLKILN